MSYTLQNPQLAGDWMQQPASGQGGFSGPGTGFQFNPRNPGGQALPQQANFQARQAMMAKLKRSPGRMRPGQAVQLAGKLQPAQATTQLGGKPAYMNPAIAGPNVETARTGGQYMNPAFPAQSAPSPATGTVTGGQYMNPAFPTQSAPSPTKATIDPAFAGTAYDPAFAGTAYQQWLKG